MGHARRKRSLTSARNDAPSQAQRAPPDGELTLVLVLARSTTDFMLRKLQARIERESAGA